MGATHTRDILPPKIQYHNHTLKKHIISNITKYLGHIQTSPALAQFPVELFCYITLELHPSWSVFLH